MVPTMNTTSIGINRRLPAELVEKLFLLLPPADQVSLALVCKNWYLVYCESSIIHKSKIVRLRAPVNNKTLMHQCLPQHQVSRLELIGISVVGNRCFLNEFLKQDGLKHVRELAVKECRMSRTELSAIISACNGLTMLHLSNMDCLFTPPTGFYRYRGGFRPQTFTDEEFVEMSTSLQSVRCLKLEGFTDLADPTFHRLTDLMPSLESLHLSNVSMRHSTDVSKYFTFSGLARFIILRAAQIKELYLDSIALQAGSIAVLLRTKQLRLKRLGLRLDTDPFFDAIRLQPELECLELCVTRAIDSRIMLPFIDSLTKLHLEQCQMNSTLTELLAQHQRLTSLSLVNVRITNLNFDGTSAFSLIVGVVSQLENLRELALVNIGGECSVDNIIGICCDLRRLERLELEGCRDLDTDAFTFMLSLQTGLREFTLHSCVIGQDYHDTMTRTDMKINMPNLEKLHLINCQLMDNVYLKFEHLPVLRSFKVACHPQSNGRGLCHFARHAPSLEVLHVSQMTRISDTYERQKTLSLMLSCLPRLRDIGLLLFGALSDDLLAWMLECCPRLHVLDIRGCTCNKKMVQTVLNSTLTDVKLT